jgi:uncharacterized protein involved in exopolysaccharide biosynthesis
MSRHTVVRLIESFFRRWWLYLLPVLLLGAFGLKTVAATKDTFRSTGTLTVATTSLVEKLSDVNNSPNFGYDTPAGATTKSLVQELQTDAFVKDVANRAGLSGALASGALTVPDIRSSILVWADGATLFHVVATMEDPVAAQKVAAATIAVFTQNVLDANVADSEGAVAFWDKQATTYQADVKTTRDALQAYLDAHPGLADPTKPRLDSQTVQITLLQSDETRAQSRYDSAVDKREEARQLAEQAKSDVGNRLSVVDAPEVPAFRQPKLRGMALTFAMFLVLGLILAVGGVVVATAFDHGLRTTLDIKERLGLRPLAAIPDAGSIPMVSGSVAVRPRRVSEATEPRRLREAPAAWEVPVAAARGGQPTLHTAAGPTRPGGPRAPRAPGAVGNSRRGTFVPGRHNPSE